MQPLGGRLYFLEAIHTIRLIHSTRIIRIPRTVFIIHRNGGERLYYDRRRHSRYEEDRLEEFYEELAYERGSDAVELAKELRGRGWDEEEIRDRLDY